MSYIIEFKVTLQEAAEIHIREYGSIRNAARILKMDHSYLHRLARGEKSNPGKAILDKLGIRKVVSITYFKELAA